MSQCYFLSMKTEPTYPTVEAFLKEGTVVQSWAVDDLVKMLKKIEDGLRKIEMAAGQKNSAWYTKAQQERDAKELRALFKKLTDQLDRLLGVSI